MGFAWLFDLEPIEVRVDSAGDRRCESALVPCGRSPEAERRGLLPVTGVDTGLDWNGSLLPPGVGRAVGPALPRKLLAHFGSIKGRPVSWRGVAEATLSGLGPPPPPRWESRRAAGGRIPAGKLLASRSGGLAVAGPDPSWTAVPGSGRSSGPHHRGGAAGTALPASSIAPYPPGPAIPRRPTLAEPLRSGVHLAGRRGSRDASHDRVDLDRPLGRLYETVGYEGSPRGANSARRNVRTRGHASSALSR